MLASSGLLLYKTLPRSEAIDQHATLKASSALIVEGALDPHATLEIGLFPIKKDFFGKEVGDQWILYSAYKMHIETLYRYYIWSNLSVATGLATSYSMGDPDIVGHSADYGHHEIESEDVSREAIYSLSTSIQWKVLEQENWLGFFDIRFNHDWINGTEKQWGHGSIFLGAKYKIEKVGQKL